MPARLAAAVALGAVLFAGCGGSASSTSGQPSARNISRATWHGGPWPFTVSSGVVACIQPPITGAVIFTAPDGTAYAINGTAEDQGKWPNVRPIWRRPRHPLFAGQRVDLGGVIDAGLKLCH